MKDLILKFPINLVDLGQLELGIDNPDSEESVISVAKSHICGWYDNTHNGTPAVLLITSGAEILLSITLRDFEKIYFGN